MKKQQYPTVTINDKGLPFIQNGQNWMYANNLASDISALENGCVVTIKDQQGHYLATGHLSKESHILVRILSRKEDEIIDRDFLKKRIEFAYQYRKTVERDNLTNCRLIFGEADLLPGLTCDRYNDILVCQISSYGMEVIKDLVYELLLEVLNQDGQSIHNIYQRNDLDLRKKEGLPLYKGYWKESDQPTKTIINENGLLLQVDFESGQKTGYFLDQKTNRVLLRKLSKDKKVLDCFSHTGGFALNAALGQAKKVTAVDVSALALQQGLQNAKLNHLENRIEFVQDDVFDYLDKIEKGAYDIIVLDPPAFTKSRRTIDHAYQGYKEINTKAMQRLNSGGYLISCSCSRFMEVAHFEKMLKDAAQQAHVVLKQVSVTQQNSDHPILWNMDETEYLKFYIFQVV